MIVAPVVGGIVASPVLEVSSIILAVSPIPLRSLIVSICLENLAEHVVELLVQLGVEFRF